MSPNAASCRPLAINFQLQPYKNQCLNRTINLPCIIFPKFVKNFNFVLLFSLNFVFKFSVLYSQNFTSQVFAIMQLNCFKLLKHLLRIFLILLKSFQILQYVLLKLLKMFLNCLKLYISNCLKIARCLKIIFQIWKAIQNV